MRFLSQEDEDITEIGWKSRVQTVRGNLSSIMAKKRLSIGARVQKEKWALSDGVIKSSLGKGRWMIKWSDNKAQEEVHSWSLALFEGIEERSSISSSDGEDCMNGDGSLSESENEYGKKSEKFDKFSSTLFGKSVEVINYHFFQVEIHIYSLI